MDVILAIAVGAVVLGAYVAALASAIVQIGRTPELASIEKWVWAAGIVFFPVVGCLAWFALGPHPFGLRLTHDLT